MWTFTLITLPKPSLELRQLSALSCRSKATSRKAARLAASPFFLQAAQHANIAVQAHQVIIAHGILGRAPVGVGPRRPFGIQKRRVGLNLHQPRRRLAVGGAEASHQSLGRRLEGMPCTPVITFDLGLALRRIIKGAIPRSEPRARRGRLGGKAKASHHKLHTRHAARTTEPLLPRLCSRAAALHRP